jgi:hypothetical protein
VQQNGAAPMMRRLAAPDDLVDGVVLKWINILSELYFALVSCLNYYQTSKFAETGILLRMAFPFSQKRTQWACRRARTAGPDFRSNVI